MTVTSTILTVEKTTTKVLERGQYGRPTRTMTERKRVPVSVPTSWSMYTAAGNRSITKKATTLLRKVEKLVSEGRATRANVRKALVAFVASWERMGDSKSYGEAADTAVRECVGAFHDTIWAACFGYCGYEVWEETRSESYHRAKGRAKKAKVEKCSPAAPSQKAALLAFLTA